ncbi:MAG TPA: PP2C family protein-serine/threonine phosphatase, partial [Fodinibius sp.]|nr:PP2C family protein-serine/threonine phosphatase [Fodinibius sp.]
LETPEQNLLFAIADVTGKGMPAALLMANLQAMLHVLLPTDISLAEATAQVNDIIHRNTPSDKFITFFWGIFHPQDRTFTYVNAGHNPPLLFKKDGPRPQELQEGGLILGAMPTMTPYNEQQVMLEKDDLLIFYTDGVTEAMNPKQTEEFGEERLINCILAHRRQPSRQIKQAIIGEVRQFAGSLQSDDLTLIVVKGC